MPALKAGELSIVSPTTGKFTSLENYKVKKSTGISKTIFANVPQKTITNLENNDAWLKFPDLSFNSTYELFLYYFFH